MKKDEFLAEVAARSCLSKAEAGRAIDGMCSVLAEVMKKGDRVSLTGFASFDAVTRKARSARNPSTGLPMVLPQRKAPRMRPSSKLVTEVNS